MSEQCEGVQKVFVPGTVSEKARQNEGDQEGLIISEKAAAKIKSFLEADGKSPLAYGLKIVVKDGGCSGHSYSMDLNEIEPAVEAGDLIFTYQEANVIIDKESYAFVENSTLDYVEAFTGAGFVLNNPNVKKTCACGSSFAV